MLESLFNKVVGLQEHLLNCHRKEILDCGKDLFGRVFILILI